jgi:hypothetical protein
VSAFSRDEPTPRLLPPDVTARLATPPVVSAAAADVRRAPARTRDERRLARIDRKVAERDTPQ